MTNGKNGVTRSLEILGGKGIIGVMIILVLLAGGMGYLAIKVATNDIEHSTDSRIQQATALTELKATVENTSANQMKAIEKSDEITEKSTEAIEELTDVFKDYTSILKKQ